MDMELAAPPAHTSRPGCSPNRSLACPRDPVGATEPCPDTADGHAGDGRDDGAGGRSDADARPRERLLTAGPEGLSPADLVALLLGTGTTGRPVALLAQELVSSAGGLRGLSQRTAAELSHLPGLGSARAARLLAAVELGRRLAAEPLARGAALRSSADVFRHFHPSMRELQVEQFRVVLLDGKHRFLRDELVSQGTLTSSPVHPREVFSAAIRHAAAAVVLVHNHPSGDPSPSADDLEITRRLCDVGALVGIRVLDHVVVGDGAYTSFAERGLMSFPG